VSEAPRKRESIWAHFQRATWSPQDGHFANIPYNRNRAHTAPFSCEKGDARRPTPSRCHWTHTRYQRSPSIHTHAPSAPPQLSPAMAKRQSLSWPPETARQAEHPVLARLSGNHTGASTDRRRRHPVAFLVDFLRRLSRNLKHPSAHRHRVDRRGGIVRTPSRTWQPISGQTPAPP